MPNSWDQGIYRTISCVEIVSYQICMLLLSEKSMINHNSRRHHMDGKGKREVYYAISLVLRGENKIGLWAPHID